MPLLVESSCDTFLMPSFRKEHDNQKQIRLLRSYSRRSFNFKIKAADETGHLRQCKIQLVTIQQHQQTKNGYKEKSVWISDKTQK